MNCRDIEPLLYLVREGELTGEEQKIISEHIATCSNCRQIYESVKKMTGIVSRASFGGKISGNSQVLVENIIREIDKTKFTKPESVLYRYNSFIRGIAASVLILIASTIAYQELDFYSHKSAVNISVQKEENFRAVAGSESDCLRELKRKYRIRAFTRPREENLVMNRLNQEQLTEYIDQVCAGTGDISKVKKMLIQSGVIKMIQEN